MPDHISEGVWHYQYLRRGVTDLIAHHMLVLRNYFSLGDRLRLWPVGLDVALDAAIWLRLRCWYVFSNVLWHALLSRWL